MGQKKNEWAISLTHTGLTKEWLWIFQAAQQGVGEKISRAVISSAEGHTEKKPKFLSATFLVLKRKKKPLSEQTDEETPIK